MTARFFQFLSLTIGALCLTLFGYHQAERIWFQQHYSRVAAEAPRLVPVTAGAPLGRIEIPRIDLSAVIVAGSDDHSLRLGVGHIDGTAWPGEFGNIGLAGHRDTFFSRIGELKKDDVIRLVTPGGTSVYYVRTTRITDPTDLSVIQASASPMLTLITCYPFRYIGPAPRRYILTADAAPGSDGREPEKPGLGVATAVAPTAAR